MSLPQPTNAPVAPATREAKEKHRMSKVLYQVKTVFRKSHGSKRGPPPPIDLPPTQAPLVRPARSARCYFRHAARNLKY